MQLSLSHSRPNYRPFLILLLLATLAVFALTSVGQIIDFTTSHGIDRHSYSAVHVRACLYEKGPLQVWENPETGRQVNLCQLEETLFGLQIVAKDTEGKWHEITAFLKEKFTRLEQVENYLRNSGYKPLE